MKSRRIAALAIASVFLLGSCDAILGFNLFEGMVQDGVVRNIEEAETADDYMAESDAENFIEALEETGKVEDAVGALEEVYDPDADPETPPPGDPAEAQEAAAVAAEIIIYTSPAGVVVDNIIEVIAGDPAALDVEDPATLIAAIIPPSITGDAAAFEETILGFLDAWEAYAALGASITGGELATVEVQAGDLIIPAAIGAALSELVAAEMAASSTDEATATAQIIAGLLDAATGGTPTLPEIEM
ncbi:MAG TPA: hypothetical protein PKW82_12125, partial [Spirochaetales bacterium]|nr:hypothetical protein [Spirochaetales bacterium]